MESYTLYCAATQFELEAITGRVIEDYYVDHDKIYLVSGVGIAETSYSVGKICAKYSITSIVNLGIAGAFRNTDLNLGEVVFVQSDTWGDLGCSTETGFLSLGEMGLETQGPYVSGAATAWPVQHRDVLSLKMVKGITVQNVCGTEEVAQERWNLFQPHVESMEGAAVMMVANNENIPCFQIRSISNYCGKRNREEWDIAGALNRLKEFFNE